MKSKLLGLMAVIALLGLFPSSSHALTFDFSFTCTNCLNAPPGGGTVTGEIDGLSNGPNVNVADVIIDSYPSAFTIPTPLPFNTSCGNCLVTTNSFTVTAGAITAYDFEVTGTTSLWSLALGAIAGEESFSNGTGETQINIVTQGVSFEPVGAPTTPLPAALPLFATGLGALGLFGWRKKRKAHAIA
jgi:hypothetical protein